MPLAVASSTPASGQHTASQGQNASAFAAQLAGSAPPAATTAVTGALPAAQVAPILAAAQAALAQTVNLSPEAQQAIKAEAFAKVVAQLVQQIQGGAVQMPARWPAGGVVPEWQTLLSALVQQATAGQPLPQQLVGVQSWPSALAQAVLQEGQKGSPAGSGAGAQGGQAQAGQQQMAGTAAAGNVARPNIPALQNWLVQQGVVTGVDGERGFTLTLKVPVAWAQAQAVLGQALASRGASPLGVAAMGLPSGVGTLAAALVGSGSAGLQLPYGSSVQQLANAAFGLVLQPQGLNPSQAQAMRTSAVLLMEFQPLSAAATATQQATAAALLPAGVMPQEAYQALLARGGDPWLHMQQLHASGQLPRERQHHGTGTECTRSDCQYQGRAECAQPFCAEMNSLWAASRASRR